VSHGYRVTELELFDLFPLTHHVEILALLESENPVRSGSASPGSEIAWGRALKDPPTRVARKPVGGSFRARRHSVTQSPGGSANLKEPDAQDQESNDR
jgi:hypothetical protein